MKARSGEGAASTTVTDSSRSIRLGLAAWVVFAVVAVAVRGVRWDEAYEHAQILARDVSYPHSHPLYRYVHNGFSLQTYLAAAVVAVAPQPVVLCGIRNVLFVLASVVPAYLFAGRLTGDALWAHAAALLTLNGTLLEFDSSYPTAVWPNTFTNGHLGGGYMLLTLYMVLAHRPRAGLFLLGLAPAVHIGQLPAIAGVCALFIAWRLVRGGRTEFVRAIPWGIAGLAICLGFAGVMRLFHVSDPGPPPDAEQVHAIWQGYTSYFDPHRQFPPANAHVAAGLTLLLGAGIAIVRGESEPLWRWLFVYSAIVAATVWSIVAVHAALGPDIPFLLIGWMPYRLLNLLPPILLVTLIGILARGNSCWILGAALAVAAAATALHWSGIGFIDRYFASGEFIVFVLAGAAVVQIASEPGIGSRFRAAWLVTASAGLLALAFVHQWGAACTVLGAVAEYIALRAGAVRLPAFPRPLATAACAVLAALLLVSEVRAREHLPRSAFDAEVAATLADRGQPDALLLAHPYEFLLQVRTGHPVLVETATASLMSYLPELGPGIQQTYLDLYGIRFDQPPTAGRNAWKSLWQQRTKHEWNTLAERYQFDYVVAPAPLVLDLDRVATGDSAALYRARAIREP